MIRKHQAGGSYEESKASQLQGLALADTESLGEESQELGKWNEGGGVLITAWEDFNGMGVDAVKILRTPLRDSNSAMATSNCYVRGLGSSTCWP